MLLDKFISASVAMDEKEALRVAERLSRCVCVCVCARARMLCVRESAVFAGAEALTTRRGGERVRDGGRRRKRE